MTPNIAVKPVKEVLTTAKTGLVGKLKTEVRTKIPIAVMKPTQRRNYTLNKSYQVNRIVQKNKTFAPVQTKYNNNDIVLKYSPAVFLEAVTKVTD